MAIQRGVAWVQGRGILGARLAKPLVGTMVGTSGELVPLRVLASVPLE